MSRTAWIVQTNFEKQSNSPGALRTACEIDDRPFHEISVTPGSPTLPEMPAIDGPVVVHGRTTLILRAFEHPRWRRAVFFDPERFQHRAYAAAYGDDLVNPNATILRATSFNRRAIRTNGCSSSRTTT